MNKLTILLTLIVTTSLLVGCKESLTFPGGQLNTQEQSKESTKPQGVFVCYIKSLYKPATNEYFLLDKRCFQAKSA